MSNTKERIREFIGQNLEIDMAQVSDTEPLFTGGMVDSYSLIELLSFMETELDYTVDFSELGIDDLDTIESLAQLVDT